MATPEDAERSQTWAGTHPVRELAGDMLMGLESPLSPQSSEERLQGIHGKSSGSWKMSTSRTQGGRISKTKHGQRPSSGSSGQQGTGQGKVQGQNRQPQGHHHPASTAPSSASSASSASTAPAAPATSTPALKTTIAKKPTTRNTTTEGSPSPSPSAAISTSKTTTTTTTITSSHFRSAPPSRLVHATGASSLLTPVSSAPSSIPSSTSTTPPTATSASSSSSSESHDANRPGVSTSNHRDAGYFAHAATSSTSSTSTTAYIDISSASSNTHDTDAMAVDDDPPVLTFWGPDPVPLPSRFTRIKRNLIAGHETAIEASWASLIHALRIEMDHIEELGSHLIPSIEYADIHDAQQSTRFGRDLRRYGVGVVRRAVPKSDADDMVNATVQYLDSKRTSAGGNNPTPLKQDPTCYDYYWTPAQVRSRAHPSVLRAQRFMMGLWETSPEDRLATRLPITYVDRIRIHGADGEPRIPRDPAQEQNKHNGDKTKTNGLNGNHTSPTPTSKDISSLEQHQSPQSADDWINALQSSAGIIAQVDNGSLERWEPDGYGHAGTYSRVFHGDWQSYDPWECASRTSATMDLYNGYGACTIFRMFQGVLALSTIEPGMVRLLPSPKLATAYYLLRPFFNPKTPAPAVRSGPEWEAYLDPSNWRLERDPDTIIHGAVPGHAQRITELWHPHLHLRKSMITFPTLQPGDYIFWHPDLPYHISSSNPGLQTPHPQGGDEVSMLVYIPAAPLTQTNALYLARQRKAFQRGHPGPDFDSLGRAMMVEDPETRPGEKEIAQVGGPEGLQAMGLAPWEVAATPPSGDKVKGDEEERRETGSVSPKSRSEAELVKLANIILFPDRSMMGYSV